MPQIMKVKCNDPAPHVNDIDLDDGLRPTPVLRSKSKADTAEHSRAAGLALPALYGR